jgi:hypothetical protein
VLETLNVACEEVLAGNQLKYQMRTQNDFNEEHAFEEEVRRVANALWPTCIHPGPINILGSECDGYYETEENVHLLESTTSRTLEKAKQDVSKLDAAASKLRKQNRDKLVKTWFITRFDPTADQMEVVRKSASQVTAQSFAAFQQKLIDVGTYLECRLKHRFGSIDHPIAGESPDKIKYIQIPILTPQSHEEWSVDKIANTILAGECLTLLGDYGIGKSMTLREVFRYLRARYLQKHTAVFPIYINLREHHGQAIPAEILERHAREIGYPVPSHLVRAWKAGYVSLILDGFDEVASGGLETEWRQLRAARNVALTGVRRLIADSPQGCGIAIAGRQSFFDSDAERNETLGDRRFKVLLLHEFTEDQVTAFFKSVGFAGTIPPWLPARPLLLSTIFWLYTKQVQNTDRTQPIVLPDDPSIGWGVLLEAISEREAKIEVQVTGSTIRRILETLATKARTTTSGLGPLTTNEITGAFQAIMGIPPSPQALSVLQRLPGLGIEPNSDGALRSFLDEDLVDALGASDVFRALSDPFSLDGSAGVLLVRKSLDGVGFGILTRLLEEAKYDRKRAVQTIKEFERRNLNFGALADLISFCQLAAVADKLQVRLTNLEIGELSLTENTADLSGIVLKSCVLRRLVISHDAQRALLPSFTDCLIEHLQGVLSATDLPTDHFTTCSIEHYVDEAITNAGILRAEMKAEFRVLLTVLRKLFVQGLSGRQEHALRRGMENADQATVPGILDALYREGLVTKYKAANGTVVVPVRRTKRRVMAILASPLSSQDSLAAHFR